ncbi:MAG: sodium:calcium antiporter [Acidimicrobiales bacterium]
MPAPSTASDIVVFGLGALVSLGASALLVSRIERLGGRIGLSEALLGMVAALAADSPEITSSITALGSGQRTVGVGVVLGSNVFNLAALLGLGALAARKITLHRRVILLEGAVSMLIVVICLLVATGGVAPLTALVLALGVLIPYCLVIGVPRRVLARLPVVPTPVLSWLAEAVHEEAAELGGTRPARDLRHGPRYTATAVISLGIVIAASIAMEHAGTAIGSHFRLSATVTGGVILAAVTSLPNAVAAVYLARRGRGAAVLSEAMNSNALNVVVGLLVPAVAIGLGRLGPAVLGVAWWYAGLSLAALVGAFLGRGVSRVTGGLILLAYAVFVISLVIT